MQTAQDVTGKVLIIGSGAAGLTLALRVADSHEVAIVSKDALSEGSTRYAQGGISAVLDSTDSLEAHAADTMAAGAGLCDPDIVRFAIQQGPAAIAWLIDQGVEFTRNGDSPGSDSGYHLTREGGHSHRRVIHAEDRTGQAIENTLEARVRQHPNITVLEYHVAIDLISVRTSGQPDKRCAGAYLLNTRDGQVRAMPAAYVVLATGGASKVYLYTSNPRSATGDGIAMAWRAGCRIANMEFMQFHPTCLYLPGQAPSADARSFLISEAVRGEGGYLLLPDGTRFMPAFDERAELAPRDVVARAIDHEMKRLGLEHVWLDISHKGGDFIRKHFPTIYQRCLELGHDMSSGPIPVVPAAHYTCGGVMTDHCGRTDLPGLYAVGETAFTGLHGANRMASNSLLECLVFSTTAGADIVGQPLPAPAHVKLPAWDESRVTDSDEEIVVSHNWLELRRLMWDYVGIVRSTKRLRRARDRVQLLQREIDEYYSHFVVTPDLLELRNLTTVAQLIIDAAMRRRESRGLHFSLDYPERNPDDRARTTILVPDGFVGGELPVCWHLRPGSGSIEDNQKPGQK